MRTFAMGLAAVACVSGSAVASRGKVSAPRLGVDWPGFRGIQARVS